MEHRCLCCASLTSKENTAVWLDQLEKRRSGLKTASDWETTSQVLLICDPELHHVVFMLYRDKMSIVPSMQSHFPFHSYPQILHFSDQLSDFQCFPCPRLIPCLINHLFLFSHCCITLVSFTVIVISINHFITLSSLLALLSSTPGFYPVPLNNFNPSSAPYPHVLLSFQFSWERPEKMCCCWQTFEKSLPLKN